MTFRCNTCAMLGTSWCYYCMESFFTKAEVLLLSEPSKKDPHIKTRKHVKAN